MEWPGIPEACSAVAADGRVAELFDEDMAWDKESYRSACPHKHAWVA